MNQRFGGTYHLHLKGKKSAEQETSILTGGYIPPKHRFICGLHVTISQKMATSEA
jgi:hypothetical protein